MPDTNSTRPSAENESNRSEELQRVLLRLNAHSRFRFGLVIFYLRFRRAFPRRSQSRILRGFTLSTIWGSFIGSFLYLVHPIQAISDHQVILLSLSVTSIALVFAAAFWHIWTGNAYSSARQR